jgi:hypothetical protein
MYMSGAFWLPFGPALTTPELVDNTKGWITCLVIQPFPLGSVVGGERLHLASLVRAL